MERQKASNILENCLGARKKVKGSVVCLVVILPSGENRYSQMLTIILDQQLSMEHRLINTFLYDLIH